MFRTGLSYLKTPLSIGFVYLFLMTLPVEWIAYLMAPFLNDLAQTVVYYENAVTMPQSDTIDLIAVLGALVEHHGLSWGYVGLALIGSYICALFSKAYLTYVAHNALVLSDGTFRLPPRRSLIPTLGHKAQLLTYGMLVFKLIFLPIAVGLVFLLFWLVFGAVCFAIGFVSGADYETIFAFLITDGLLFMSLFGVFYVLAYSFYFVHDFRLKRVFDFRQNFLFIRQNWLRMVVLIGVMAGAVFLIAVVSLVLNRILHLALTEVTPGLQLIVQTAWLIYAQLVLAVLFGKCLAWVGRFNTVLHK